MLSVMYAECRKLAHYPECRYAECRYAECRGTVYFTNLLFTMQKVLGTP